nr:galectin-7-like [Symphalangus syndactylus]
MVPGLLSPPKLSTASLPLPRPLSSLLGPQQAPPPGLPDPVPAMSNVPHKSSLPEGIRPGTVLRIRGLVPPNASRFHVNLLCGEEQGSDAALHFNPWLDTSEVVFNSKEQGSWGREERGPGVPFQRGQPFEVLIIASDDGFKAVIGDAQYHHFRHRLPLARVRLVEVGGDVQLDSVKIF